MGRLWEMLAVMSRLLVVTGLGVLTLALGVALGLAGTNLVTSVLTTDTAEAADDGAGRTRAGKDDDDRRKNRKDRANDDAPPAEVVGEAAPAPAGAAGGGSAGSGSGSASGQDDGAEEATAATADAE